MNTEASRDSSSSDREMVNVVSQDMAEISELPSVRTDLEFPPAEEEVETNEPQGQPQYDYQPPLQEQTTSGVEPSNFIEPANQSDSDSEHSRLIPDTEASHSPVHPPNPDSARPNRNITWNNIRKNVSAKMCCVIILSVIGIGMFTIMVTFTGLYERMKLKHNFNSQCLNAPSSTEILIAQNSAVILLNTTEYYLANLQTCYEPNVAIETKYLVNVSLIPCQNLQYSNYLPKNRTSLNYTNAKNPLPVAFDETCCQIPNYLVNGHINVTVSITTSELNPLTPEYIYFCLYTDYNQFQNVRSESTKSYWKNYNGKQCNRQQLAGGDNVILLKNEFNITGPEYVFIDFGSTLDPLDTFQFNISASGQTVLYPGQSSFFNESCSFSDGRDSCQIALNLAHVLEPMCIVGFRRNDRSGVPFGSLVVKLSPIKPYKAIKIIMWFMIISVVSVLIIAIMACIVLVLFVYYKICKSDTSPIEESTHNYSIT